MAEKKEEKSEKEDAPETRASEKEGDAPAEGDAAKKAKPGISKKTIIIAGVAGGVVLLVVIAIVVLLATGVLGGKKHEESAEAVSSVSAAGGGHGKDEGEARKDAVFYDLGDMVVNLTSDGKRTTFLKLVVQLELENAADKAAIEALKPRIVDNFQTYLRELRVDDLKGSAGLYRLREELLFRVTDAVYPVKVRDVLFQQMLVQ